MRHLLCLRLLLQWYMTPLDYAETNGHADTAALLREDPRYVAAEAAGVRAAERAAADARTKRRLYV